MSQTKGRVTIPTNLDVVPETIELMKRWGADAIRDCDGTEFPEELTKTGAKIYATYYTTRKDNEWASANPEEIQQEYLISNRVTARGETLRIRLMEGFHTEQLKVNTLDDPKRWWEVIDRTTGEIVPTDKWEFDEATGELTFATDRFSTYIVVYEDVANSNTEDKSNVSGNGSAADNNDVAEDSAATADDSAATADTLSVTRTIILLAVLMISAGVICLTLYRRKENA